MPDNTIEIITVHGGNVVTDEFSYTRNYLTQYHPRVARLIKKVDACDDIANNSHGIKRPVCLCLAALIWHLSAPITKHPLEDASYEYRISRFRQMRQIYHSPTVTSAERIASLEKQVADLTKKLADMG